MRFTGALKELRLENRNRGEAWRLCRAGQADPDLFGIFDLQGLWFIRGNVVRDLAPLNKMELLTWDCWGVIDRDFETLRPKTWPYSTG